MGIRLDSPEEVIAFPPIDSIPDGPEDQPAPGPLLEEKIAPIDLPELISGAAAWSHFYNHEDKLSTDVPLRTIRLALRYGIRAFDTAPFYDNSEIVLGTALKALEAEFPRGSYQLLSKVGRYGPTPADFDYSPDAIRRSVRRSLQRLHTEYLDVVYLHDIEFVAPCVAPRGAGNHAAALGAEAEAYGLATLAASSGSGDGGQVRTAGDDERVLQAISTLRSLQADGLIRHVGISGLPLPALLRTALLVLNRTGRPLDIVQTYAHLTLQNSTLPPFATALRVRARVPHVTAASPLSMGLLAPPPNAPPAWHPAPDAVRAAAAEAVRAVGPEQVAGVAVAWSLHAAGSIDDGTGTGTGTAAGAGAGRIPVVVGTTNLREVHEAVAAWRWAKDVGRLEELERKAALAQAVFERTGTAGWTWSSGNWV